ncbi:MAG TPA: HAMP domain-containing sensor histidine kinase [Anaeromyxobacteraceae bacterium]|nr:HAMP domain-containing sensor histidine kinase [Anaeromyxobacteraceae bacterium]
MSRGRAFPSRTAAFAAAMAGLVAFVAAIAYLDEERESGAALSDFAQEQSNLAAGVAAALAVPGAAVEAAPGWTPGSRPPERLVHGLAALDRPGSVRVLLRPPAGGDLVDLDGRRVSSPPLSEAFDAGLTSIRLSRDEAAAAGLPPRTAVAGVASVALPPGGTWGIAVVANAQRLRDREARARRRLVLAVFLAGGLVVGLGGTALRRQRRQMDLERELAVADVARRRDERLERSERAAMLGTFAMGVAHEISTPLGIISGRAEQALAAPSDPVRVERAARAILEQSDRIHQVIRAFLGLARGEAPEARELSAAEIATRALSLCEHRFSRAGVVLEADLADGLPPLRGDASLLEQALVNLLLNACDACERGGRVQLVLSGGDRIAFSVIDDGVGIAPADAERVTEPFFTTKPSGRGSGLGLAIVSEIAKHHHGALAIEPRQPRGTIARLEIPAAGRAP